MTWTLLLVSLGLQLNIAIPMKDEGACFHAKAAVIRDMSGLYDRAYCLPSNSRNELPVQSPTE